MKNQQLFLLFALFTMCTSVMAQKNEPENLGRKINSFYGEIAPIITPDGKTLYFVRDKHPSNDCNQAIWVAYLQEDSTWGQATKMPLPFNTLNNNSINSVSANGNTLLVSSAYKNGEYAGKGYSISKKTPDGWGTFESINIRDYAKMSNGIVAFANMATNGKVLFLCFSTSGNNSNNDLFVSFKDSDTTWSTPRPLPDLNTEYNDITPFLAMDGKTMYFSSNRPNGQGKFDIYFTKREDSTYLKWSKPENMGADFNTPESEAYYAIDAKGEYAYLSTTNKSIGAQDIVRIKLQEEVKPDPVVLVGGKIKDKEGKPIMATITYEELSSGKEVGQLTTNPEDGSYQIFLPYGKKYAYTVAAENYFSASKNIDLSETAEYKEVQQDFELPKIEVGAIVRINNIFFEKNSEKLLPESYPELNRLAKMLNEKQDLNIEISGHTDSEGSDAYNKALSKRRAKSVQEYLFTKEITVERIKAVGHGEEKPIADNKTKKGRAANRRVEFEVLGK